MNNKILIYLDSKATHREKVEYFFNNVAKPLIPLVAADFVERVLYIYESKYPGDSRPREAVVAARSGNYKKANAAAYAAANAAYTAYAASAAANVAHAAAYAANAANVAHAAANAINAAGQAINAANAAAYAAESKTKEEAAQLTIMKYYLNNKLINSLFVA